MNQTFTKTLFLLALVVTCLGSCVKTTKDELLTITPANIDGTYTLVSVVEQYNNQPQVDITRDYKDACEMDDEYVLHSDFNIFVNDAGQKCYISGSYDSIWELDGDLITFDKFEGIVDKLTRNEMVIVSTYSRNNQSWKEVATFRRR